MCNYSLGFEQWCSFTPECVESKPAWSRGPSSSNQLARFVDDVTRCVRRQTARAGGSRGFSAKVESRYEHFFTLGTQAFTTAALDVISGSGCSALDTKASVPNHYDGARATEARTGHRRHTRPSKRRKLRC